LEQRYSRLPFVWLDLTRGEDGVFLIEVDELHKHFGHGGSEGDMDKLTHHGAEDNHGRFPGGTESSIGAK
ncbi:MAG: hypothetical protein ACREYF_02260, partial [Gammaproteobacteria bacterium]